MNTSCRGKVVALKDDRKIIDCRNCGYIHVFPLYSAEELEQFYGDIYPESTPSYLWFEKVHNIEKWKKKGTVLDVGCWEGTQLECFMKEGWECTGLELNKRTAAIAKGKGIEVYEMSIQQLFDTVSDRKWDVINVAFLLEHIPEPIQFLSQIKELLNEDGIIIVEVPNDFSPFQLAYLKEHRILPYWIFLPDHLNYFTKAKLKNILKRTGWTIIHGESSFPMEMFLLMGDNYLEDNSIGKRSFKKVVEMERVLREYDPSLVSRLYSSMYACNVGRSITVYARIKR